MRAKEDDKVKNTKGDLIKVEIDEIYDILLEKAIIGIKEKEHLINIRPSDSQEDNKEIHIEKFLIFGTAEIVRDIIHSYCPIKNFYISKLVPKNKPFYRFLENSGKRKKMVINYILLNCR